MKKAFFALTAVLAAGLASAVTSNWSSGGTGTGSLTAVTTWTSTSSYSVSVVFTAEDLATALGSSSSVSLLGVGGATNATSGTGPSFLSNLTSVDTSTGAITLSITGKLTQATTEGLTTGTGNAGSYSTLASSLSATVNTTHVNQMVLTVEMSTNDSSQTVATYSLYLNGELIASGYHTNITYDLSTAYVSALDDAYVYYVNEAVAADSDQLTVLPEPTVLALLALGVAGIALRRKA